MKITLHNYISKVPHLYMYTMYICMSLVISFGLPLAQTVKNRNNIMFLQKNKQINKSMHSFHLYSTYVSVEICVNFQYPNLVIKVHLYYPQFQRYRCYRHKLQSELNSRIYAFSFLSFFLKGKKKKKTCRDALKIP